MLVTTAGLLGASLTLATGAVAAETFSLGTASGYSVLAGTTVTNTGATTLAGSLGVSPGVAATGFPPGDVGEETNIGNGAAAAAQADLATADGQLAALGATGTIGPEIGGTTLTPGVYDAAAAALQISGGLTLDAQGDPDAVFVLRASSTLTTAANSTVTLAGGAQACNVFWRVGSSATLGTGSSLAGTILATASITATGGAAIQGRALARGGAVTLDTNAVTAPGCLAAVDVTLATSVAAVRFGESTTLTATLAPSTATGTVTFTNVASSGAGSGTALPIGTAAVVGGVATLTVALPAFGLNTVTASYSGDSTHAPASSTAVTVEVAGYAGQVIVTEFRASGPAGDEDSYVELYNTGPPVPLGGFVVTMGSGASTTLAVGAGTLGTHRSYLLTGATFSLGGISTSDQGASGLAVDGIQVNAPDSVGTLTDAAGPNTGFHLGTGLAPMTAATSEQHAWVRTRLAGRPVNTGSNAADFQLVSTSGGVVGGLPSTLGSPSPTGTADAHQHNAALRSTLLDPAASSSASPNRLYVAGTPGTLTVRRVITNTSEVTILSAQARITALSAVNGAPKPGATQPATRANLRLIDPATGTSSVTMPGGGTATVTNLTVDSPVTGAPGGGLNSTLILPVPQAGLAPGASMTVAFTFAVDTSGSYWFGYDVDAVSGPPAA